MNEDIEMSTAKRVMFVLVVLICCVWIAKAIFVMGASEACSNSDGTLFKHGISFRCINLSSVDICEDSGFYRQVTVPDYDFDINISG